MTKAYISINAHVIRRNTRAGTNEPPIRVQKGDNDKAPVYANEVYGKGWSLKYDARRPLLKCGARLVLIVDDYDEIGMNGTIIASDDGAKIGTTISQIGLAMRFGRSASYVSKRGQRASGYALDDINKAITGAHRETWQRLSDSRGRCTGYRRIA